MGSKTKCDDKESVWEFSATLSEIQKEFLLQICHVIMLMVNFLDDQYVDNVLSACRTVGGKRTILFKRKSISGNSKQNLRRVLKLLLCRNGSCMVPCNHCRKISGKTINFLKTMNCRKNKKMTAQKSRDSFRISKENKIRISELSH